MKQHSWEKILMENMEVWVGGETKTFAIDKGRTPDAPSMYKQRDPAV